MTAQNKRYTVRLRECNSSDNAYDKTVRVLIPLLNENNEPVSERDAVTPAVRKMFGKKAFWQKNIGLGDGWNYGQVFEPVSQKIGGGNSSRTGRARIEVIEGW